MCDLCKDRFYVARLVLSLVVLLALEMPGWSQQNGTDTAVASRAKSSAQWFADAQTGCKLFVRQLRPLGREGGVWKGEIQTTATWSGSCIDGLASGLGTAILSIKPSSIPPDIAGLLAGVADWPPFENIFHGTFDKGKPNGSFIIKYSNRLTTVADYADGSIVGTPRIHIAIGQEELWATLPEEQIERLVQRDFRRGHAQPIPIDPREAGKPDFVSPRMLSPAAARRLRFLFDFERYGDYEAMRDAIDSAFPRFSIAPSLLSFLNEASNENIGDIYFDRQGQASCLHQMGLAVFEQAAWYCIVSYRRDVGNGNTDRWVYAVVIGDNSRIIISEFHQFFEGSNFAARHSPLKAENFVWSRDFMTAAQQLLGPSPSLAQVSSLMESAGMTKGSKLPPFAVPPSRERESTTVEFYREEGLFSFFVSGCGKVIDLRWEFDEATGKFLSVHPADGTGCL
jgi:hypothetical protein